MALTNLNFQSIQTKSANYTANTYDDLTLLDATSASFTATLPPAASMKNQKMRFKRTDAVSANTVTIDGNASETINGSNTFVMIAQDQELDIISDGSNWIVTTQIKINASMFIAAPGSFSTGSASYVNLNGAQYATKTLAGGAQNPTTTNDAAIKIAFLPKGTYSVVGYLAFYNSTSGSSVTCRVFDGTNQIGQNGTGNATNAATATCGGTITYATDQANITFTLQGHAAGAATFTTGSVNGSGPSDVTIVISRLN